MLFSSISIVAPVILLHLALICGDIGNIHNKPVELIYKTTHDGETDDNTEWVAPASEGSHNGAAVAHGRKSGKYDNTKDLEQKKKDLHQKEKDRKQRGKDHDQREKDRLSHNFYAPRAHGRTKPVPSMARNAPQMRSK